MSIIKAYYVTRASSAAGYTDDGDTFNEIANFSSYFDIQVAAVGIDPNNGKTDANKLFLTSDGGVTWTPITGYDSVSDNTQLISAVYMNSTASIMYVVGTLRIIRSTDGGNTWSTGVSFTGGVSPTYGAGFSAVNDTVQYVLGTSGGQNNALFKPNGIFWDLISTDNTVNQSFLLSFYNELEGYTSRYINGENQILRTFDGGATWNSVDTAPSAVVTLESVLYSLNFAKK
ncbi:MAG: exo-alpha-sialidase [Flavobacteriia bacterium]|nr:exo-alpha-sialidase [Flavobacteriia bacterium]